MSVPVFGMGEAPLDIIDGDRGKNYPKQNELLDYGHCLFLSATNVTKDGFVFDSCQFITESKDNALRKGKVHRRDVILTTRGTLGNVAFYSDDVPFEHVRINSGMVTIQADPTKLRPRYLYYFLKSASFQSQVRALQSGAAQPQLPIRDIKKIKIPIPDVTVQDDLAQIVGAYDDLIENNRRRIALLEEAARLLYREWFVHLRFPGHEHVKITDGVPDGWARMPLMKLAVMIMGQSPKSEHYNSEGDGLPFHQGVTNYGFRYVTDEIYSTFTTKLAEPNDILFSVRAPVGRINITLNKIVLGRGLAAFRSKFNAQSFLFYQLKSHFFKEDLIGGGAIYAATNKKELEKLELLQPNDDLVREFEEISRPIDDQIRALTLQIENLVQARDLLLPRLMDGRIEV